MNTCIPSNKVKEGIEKLSKTVKVCKSVYSFMIQNIKCYQVCKQKWGDIGIMVEDEEWKKLYNLPYISTMEAKLQSFQYQIMKRSLVTNRFLYLCKIKDTNACYFCNRSVETVEHLLFDWNVVKNFWYSVANALPRSLNCRQYLNRKDVLLGRYYDSNNRLLNHLFILCKRYIYITKWLNRQLNVDGLLRYVKRYYLIENKIAIMENKHYLFEKWRTLENMLDSI